MRYFLFIIVAFLLSCTETKNKTEESRVQRIGTDSIKTAHAVISENQKQQLKPFDTEQVYEGDIFTIYDSLEQNINTMQPDSVYAEVRFYYRHVYKQKAFIYLPFLYKIPQEYYSTMDMRYCVVLLNKQGNVLFENEMIELDSVSDDIEWFYEKLELDSFNYCGLNCTPIVLQWDSEVPRHCFNELLDEIVDGYLQYADSFSERNYQRTVNELSKTELKKLSDTLSFHILLPELIGPVEPMPEPLFPPEPLPDSE